jgi:hypothetical protein
MRSIKYLKGESQLYILSDLIARFFQWISDSPGSIWLGDSCSIIGLELLNTFHLNLKRTANLPLTYYSSPIDREGLDCQRLFPFQK